MAKLASLRWQGQHQPKMNSQQERNSRKRSIKCVKNLKRRATAAEIQFKKILTRENVKFYFQKAFLFHETKPRFRVADFYLPESLCIIELDGSWHYNEIGVKRDNKRTAQFAQEYEHIAILRYSNADIFKPGFIDSFKKTLEIRRKEIGYKCT